MMTFPEDEQFRLRPVESRILTALVEIIALLSARKPDDHTSALVQVLLMDISAGRCTHNTGDRVRQELERLQKLRAEIAAQPKRLGTRMRR